MSARIVSLLRNSGVERLIVGESPDEIPPMGIKGCADGTGLCTCHGAPPHHHIGSTFRDPAPKHCPPCHGNCNQGDDCPVRLAERAAKAVAAASDPFVEPQFIDFSARELLVGALVIVLVCAGYVFRDWIAA